MTKKYRTYTLSGDFSSGVLSPAGQDNVRTQEWLTGAAELKNFEILRDGGIRGRNALVAQAIGRVDFPRYDAVRLGTLTGGPVDQPVVDPGGIHRFPSEVERVTEEIESPFTLTGLNRLGVSLENVPVQSVTFHNVRLASGEWRYPHQGNQIPTFEVWWREYTDTGGRGNWRRVTDDPAVASTVTGNAPMVMPGADLPAVSGNADPLVEGQAHFLPGRVARDITIRFGPVPLSPAARFDAMERLVRVQRIVVVPQAVGWLEETNKADDPPAMPAIEIRADGVSAQSYTRPEVERETDLSLEDGFVVPVRIFSWVVRDVPLVVVLTPDKVTVHHVSDRVGLDLAMTAPWAFTWRQLRELTWTEAGNDLLLLHRDFTWPLVIRLGDEEKISISRYRLTGIPILGAGGRTGDSRILRDAELGLTIRGGRLDVHRTGESAPLGDRVPEQVSATATAGGIEVDWTDTGALTYIVYWIPEGVPDNMGVYPVGTYGRRIADGDTDGALWDTPVPATAVGGAPGDPGPVYRTQTIQTRYFIPPANLVPGREYRIGIGILFQNTRIYPAEDARPVVLAKHPNPSVPQNFRARRIGPASFAPDAIEYELAWDPVPEFAGLADADFLYRIRRRFPGNPPPSGLWSIRPSFDSPPNENDTTDTAYVDQSSVREWQVRAERVNIPPGDTTRILGDPPEDNEVDMRVRVTDRPGNTGPVAMPTNSVSDWSPVVEGREGVLDPGAPVLTATASTRRNDQASLTWTAGTLAEGYEIQFQVAGAATWTTLRETRRARSRTLTGLTRDTSYNVRIRATRPVTNPSAWSNASFKTALMPAGFIAAPVLQAEDGGVIRWTPDLTQMERTYGRTRFYYYRIEYRRAGISTWPTEDELRDMLDRNRWPTGRDQFGWFIPPLVRPRFIAALNKSNETFIRTSYPRLLLGDAPGVGVLANTDFGAGASLQMRVRIETDLEITRAVGDPPEFEAFGSRSQAASPWSSVASFTVAS